MPGRLRSTCTTTLAILALVSATGCPGIGDGSPTGSTREEAPTWENGIRDLFATRCVPCHQNPPQNGAPTGFRFDAYDATEAGDGTEGVVERLDRIRARALVLRTMPPTGPLPAEARRRLQRWIDAGAPRR